VPSIFAKLKLRGQRAIVVVDAPASFEPELTALAGLRILRDAAKAPAASFALAFVTRQARLDAVSRRLASRAAGDALLWFAYPKGSPRCYRCIECIGGGGETVR